MAQAEPALFPHHPRHTTGRRRGRRGARSGCRERSRRERRSRLAAPVLRLPSMRSWSSIARLLALALCVVVALAGVEVRLSGEGCGCGHASCPHPRAAKAPAAPAVAPCHEMGEMSTGEPLAAAGAKCSMNASCGHQHSSADGQPQLRALLPAPIAALTPFGSEALAARAGVRLLDLGPSPASPPPRPALLFDRC